MNKKENMPGKTIPPTDGPQTIEVPVKVFLIGMMGTGKTYWANLIKKKLKVPAYDLDNLVEIMDERTIAEIFEQEGEEHFRKEETKMLHLFKEKKQFILSCGGGTPCFNKNMDWMNKQGITIWIDEPISILTTRLLNEKDHRPLLKNLAEDDISLFLTSKLQERLAYYKQATYRITGAEMTESKLIKIIMEHG